MTWGELISSSEMIRRAARKRAQDKDRFDALIEYCRKIVALGDAYQVSELTEWNEGIDKRAEIVKQGLDQWAVLQIAMKNLDEAFSNADENR